MTLAIILKIGRLTLLYGAITLLLAGLYFAAPDIPLEELIEDYGGERSQFISVQGQLVHLRDEGSGPPLLLVHGTSASLHTWQGWVDYFDGRYRTIRYDLPGFGLTGPRSDGDYSIAAHVAFLKALADTLGLDRFSIAGNSLGGRIAWNFALKHPERIHRLVLLDASGYPLKGNVTLAFELAQLPVIGKVLSYFTPRLLVKKSLEDVYADDGRITEELIDRYYRLALREGNRDALLARLRSARNPQDDEHLQISRITAPTLIMWGELDNGIPLSHGERFQKEIPGSRLIIYPNVGHAPMEEQPGQTARDAADFLDNLN